MTKRTKFQFQGSAIQQDMVDFLTEYQDVLKPAKQLRAKYKAVNFGKRGGKPGKIKTVREQGEGIFMTKSQQMEFERSKLRKGSLKRELRDLFKDRDVD